MRGGPRVSGPSKVLSTAVATVFVDRTHHRKTGLRSTLRGPFACASSWAWWRRSCISGPECSGRPCIAVTVPFPSCTISIPAPHPPLRCTVLMPPPHPPAGFRDFALSLAARWSAFARGRGPRRGMALSDAHSRRAEIPYPARRGQHHGRFDRG